MNGLGVELCNAAMGNRAANLHRAIACYEAALRVNREDTLPQDWAMTQSNLGVAYGDLPDGDRAANLHRAIACYEAALRVNREDTLPQDWAMTQTNIGIALEEIGDMNGTREAWQKAIRGYRVVGLEQEALEIEAALANLPSADANHA